MKLEVHPTNATKEIDVQGMWVLPGFVDVHVHCGGYPKTLEIEYVYKLWMAHGITTVRGVPCGPMDWTLKERGRSAKNEIVAPAYSRTTWPERVGKEALWKRRL